MPIHPIFVIIMQNGKPMNLENLMPVPLYIGPYHRANWVIGLWPY